MEKKTNFNTMNIFGCAASWWGLIGFGSGWSGGLTRYWLADQAPSSPRSTEERPSRQTILTLPRIAVPTEESVRTLWKRTTLYTTAMQQLRRGGGGVRVGVGGEREGEGGGEGEGEGEGRVPQNPDPTILTLPYPYPYPYP